MQLYRILNIGFNLAYTFVNYDHPIAITVQPSMLEKSSRDDKIPTDQSSVCAELDNDPDKMRQRIKEQEKKATR